MLAVLAMACFPGLAAAEENSGIQYETDVPTVPDGDGSNIPSKNNSGDSNSNPGATGSNTPGGVGSGGDDDSGTGGAGGTQPNQGSGGGSDRAADGSKPAGDVGGAKKLETAPSATGQQASSDDGGSSPLVPILIAIAVLAAISIGAYYYRQRRQGPGSTVAPPAS
ncbi:MAG: hypothetical protein M3Y75_04890 [Actinomycetota bacterium]|nr:hypothetical protein [Actinomycetota bacterium]